MNRVGPTKAETICGEHGERGVRAVQLDCDLRALRELRGQQADPHSDRRWATKNVRPTKAETIRGARRTRNSGRHKWIEISAPPAPSADSKPTRNRIAVGATKKRLAPPKPKQSAEHGERGPRAVQLDCDLRALRELRGQQAHPQSDRRWGDEKVRLTKPKQSASTENAKLGSSQVG
jgi:hypothetical protein